ncbi:MAG: MFS transporter [Sphingomonadaceae bacterium]|jgi:MFS family permease
MTDSNPWAELRSARQAPLLALMCLGIWLNAADTLVTVTIMPSVARAIGGYEWFGWTVAAYLVGSILASASAARLAGDFGTRRMTILFGLVYAAGCALGALAPAMPLFVAGRFVQGVGAGAIVALCYIAIPNNFPERVWPAVFGAISAIWGIATLLGPLLGGLFASGQHWRTLFWLFAAQALVFAALIRWFAAADGDVDATKGIPARQLVVLLLSVTALGSAALVRDTRLATALVISSALGFLALLWIDRRAKVRLLPRDAGNLSSAAGQGYFIIFATEAAAIGFSVYGTAFLQAIHGLSALLAGFILGGIAAGWTVTALLVSRGGAGRDALWLKLGVGIIAAGIVFGSWAVPRGSPVVVGVAMLLLGSGFGLAWAFIAKAIIGGLSGEERDAGSTAIPTAQLIGGAFGSAGSGAMAAALGFRDGIDPDLAIQTGPLLFLIFLPFGVAALAAAFRLARSL